MPNGYHITFCQMTQNRQIETIHCVEKYLPYVDKVIIIDGGSADDTIFYFRNWAQEEPKIEFHLVPWCDNFSKQRNEYLSRAPDNSWVLVSDPDEVFEEQTLQALPALCAEAEKRMMNMVGFQCRSASYKGPKRVHESLDNYWKRLLFKKEPGVHYVGNPHEGLAGMPHRIMDTKFIYEHIKQENVTWPRGMRNYIVNGGGPNLGKQNPHWMRLRNLMNSVGINTWHEFDAYLKRGNISQHIKEQFIMYIDLEEIIPGTGKTDGLSEMRECYKTYYRLYHPEEEPIQLRGRHIP